MRAIILGLVVVFLLSACGSPNPDVNDPAPGEIEEAPPIEAITPASESDPVSPPPLTAGTFTPLMPTAINEVLFGENNAGNFSIIGALDNEGLIYLYFHNGAEIYYAVSSNGSDWALSPEPIFTGLFNDDFEYFPASVQTIHGEYAIYCGSSTVDYAEHDYLYSVWVISASEPTGPWTLREYPSLVGWHTGVEDPIPFLVGHPIVRPYLDGYRMYYAYSFTLEDIKAPEFSTAHSWDGLIWRYTSDLPTPEMAIGVNTLRLADDYDWSGLLILDVWPTEVGWQMLYLLDEHEGETAQIYLAESENGLEWTPSDVDIQLPVDQSAENVVSASVLYYQGQYLVTYCAMPQSHVYQCFVSANGSGT